MPIDRPDAPQGIPVATNAAAVVPGLYAALHRAAATEACCWEVEERYDPRFADPEGEYAAWDLEGQAAMTGAHNRAEVVASQRIAEGQPIIGVSLREMAPAWPFFADRDQRYDVDAGDRVTVDAEKTAEWKAKRAAALAQIAGRDAVTAIDTEAATRFALNACKASP